MPLPSGRRDPRDGRFLWHVLLHDRHTLSAGKGNDRTSERLLDAHPMSDSLSRALRPRSQDDKSTAENIIAENVAT